MKMLQGKDGETPLSDDNGAALLRNEVQGICTSMTPSALTVTWLVPASTSGVTGAESMAAAFIINVRKLGEQPVNTFPKAAATLTGIRYVENSVLSALHTFTTLAGKQA